MRWTLLIVLMGLAGCAAPGHTAGAPAANPLVAGRQIYVAKCAKCHKFYDPADYSDQEWKMWMKKMSRKARLKPEQEQALTQYIDQTLRPHK